MNLVINASVSLIKVYKKISYRKNIPGPLGTMIELPKVRTTEYKKGGGIMSGFKRAVGILALGFFLTGCSAYQTMSWDPEDPLATTASRSDEEGLEVGQDVRVTIQDKSRITGRVKSWDSRELVLQKRAHGYVISEQSTPWIEMVKLERSETNTGGTVLLVGGIVVAGAAIGAAIVASQFQAPFSD